VISDPDIWRAAQLIIKRHGEDASIAAALRDDACSDRSGAQVSRQAIDRYERAQMRVSAYKLWQAAHLFRKPIGYFFEGLHQGGKPQPDATRSRIEVELLEAFRSVESRELRMEVVRFLRVAAKALAKDHASGPDDP